MVVRLQDASTWMSMVRLARAWCFAGVALVGCDGALQEIDAGNRAPVAAEAGPLDATSPPDAGESGGQDAASEPDGEATSPADGGPCEVPTGAAIGVIGCPCSALGAIACAG